MGLVVEFIVPGDPFGKQRPRFRRGKKYVSTYTPEKTVSYEEWVKASYEQAAITKGFKPMDGALFLNIYAAFKIPKSIKSKKRRAEMEGEPVTKRPDWDNIGKVVSDSLNKIAWDDDASVSTGLVKKRYTDKEPYVRVTISQDTKEIK